MTDLATAVTPLAPAPTRMLNSATLVMGASGSGKSSLLATVAEYVWAIYHKWSALYTVDGGGFPTQVQALINRGIIRVWRPRTRSGEGLAPETIHRMSQGWWPKSINPLTGETSPTVELVPPTTERFEMRCPEGHLVKTVPTANLLTFQQCPTCKVLVNAQNMKVDRHSTVTKGFENRGAALFDGISSASSWLMDDLSRRDLGGEKSRLGGTVASGNMIFGENNRAQVGFTQNRAEQWAMNALAIPGLVIPPVWTALTHETTDEGGLNIRGPLIAGQAKTAVAGQWFGNCLEAMVVEHDGKKFRRLAVAEFIDEKGIRHLCQSRCAPGLLPPFLEDEDTGNPSQAYFVNFNLGAFHKLVDDALLKTNEAYTAKYPDAPGLPDEEIVSYGETTAVAPALPVSVPPTAVTRQAPTPPAPTAAPRVTDPSVPTTAPVAVSQAASGPIVHQPPPPSGPRKAPTAPPPPGSRPPAAEGQ